VIRRLLLTAGAVLLPIASVEVLSRRSVDVFPSFL